MIKTIFVLSLSINSIFCGCGLPAGDSATTTEVSTVPPSTTTTEVSTVPPSTTTEKKNLEERILPVAVLQGEHIRVARENTTTLSPTTTPTVKCPCKPLPDFFANPENTDYTAGTGCFGHSIKCTSQPATFITNWWNTSSPTPFLYINKENTTLVSLTSGPMGPPALREWG
ncbi:uncharacterized protein CELE_ZC204.6 [Caenorhabditis elegans]|uniref:Uncharacterized protein n=1 Tax=Caenorhabditis elegans TaxID=6239 RepID=P91537_CAEEL|nr:Uncharacterized protein CELE_ZC204.6 [Caenorhabditis elegans]CCD63687.1 Uncharacterized protein CELE_ZC204.6 [Caenorhabditis elegans]|eukprot:NP_494022.1 Uncharacterized protein CELE_ZC204.6 [Caenorhabditis elegans]